MAISFICSNMECGKALAAPDGAAGKKVRCPKCGTVTTIPGPAAAPTGGSPFAVAGGSTPTVKKTRPHKVKKAKSAAPGLGFELSGVAAKFIIAIVLIVLVGGGIWATISLFHLGGQAVEKEGNAVFGAKHAAEEVVAENNLGMIRDAIRRYEVETSEYPSSLQQLVDKGELPPGALRPGKGLPDYAYIPQRPDAANDNVLAYEEQPIPHQELCNVLLHSGELVTMTPEALAVAIEKTKSTINAK